MTQSTSIRTLLIKRIPGIGAVLVEYVELFRGDEFAPVDPWLDGSQSTEDADLLHVANNRHNVEAFEFGVDRVEAADQCASGRVRRPEGGR